MLHCVIANHKMTVNHYYGLPYFNILVIPVTPLYHRF